MKNKGGTFIHEGKYIWIINSPRHDMTMIFLSTGNGNYFPIVINWREIGRKLAGLWYDFRGIFVYDRDESDYDGISVETYDCLTKGCIYWHKKYSYDSGEYGQVWKIFKWYIRRKHNRYED